MSTVIPGTGNKPGTAPDSNRGLDGKSRGTTLVGLGVYLVSFLLGFVVRAIPEAIAYPAPIGYNTVAYYAPVLLHFRSWGSSLFLSLFDPPQFSPLAFLLMIPLALVLNPYLVLAVSAPAMHGILAAVAYQQGVDDPRGMLSTCGETILRIEAALQPEQKIASLRFSKLHEGHTTLASREEWPSADPIHIRDNKPKLAMAAKVA